MQDQRTLALILGFVATTNVAAVPPATEAPVVQTDNGRVIGKLQGDAALGGTPQPDAEFWKTLAKALDECAQGLEVLSKSE